MQCARQTTASISYTCIPEGKTRAGIVIGAGSGAFPLNPDTFLAQHGSVALDELVYNPEAYNLYGAGLVPRMVSLRDAREMITPPSLDLNGFQLVHSKLPSSCSPDVLSAGEFDVERPMISAYYATVQDAVQRVTGASAVVAYCHVLRSGKQAAECKGAEAGYASYAHTDQSPVSWSSRARSLVSEEMVDSFPPGIDHKDAERAIQGRRFAVVTAWRKLNNSTASHLAVLDHTTLLEEDVLPFSIIQGKFVGGNSRLRDSADAAARHKWCYFSNMTPDDLLFFTAFDSDHPSKALLFPGQDTPSSCFHACFMDDLASEPRVSIDVRLLVIWDDDVEETNSDSIG
jgi:hypothetical protein